FYRGAARLKTLTESATGTVSVDLEKGILAVNRGPENDGAEPFMATFGELTIDCGPGVFAVVAGEEGWLEAVAGKGEVCVKSGGKKGIRECVKSGWTIAYDPEEKTFQKLQKTALAVYGLWEKMKWTVAGKAPELKLIQPAEGAMVNGSEVFVTGKATPGSTVTVNETEIPVTEKGTFSGRIPLYEGENRLTCEARGPSGGVTSVKRSVFMDSLPPILTISQPPDNFDMTMMGMCDNRYCHIQIFGLTEPGVSLQINGVDAGRYVEDDGSFLIDDFPIWINERTLTIEAEDNVGQRTVEVLYIAEPVDSDGDGAPDNLDACPMDDSCQ
ncbi:hypothetical protein ACFLQK_01215, partial [bacterium]